MVALVACVSILPLLGYHPPRAGPNIVTDNAKMPRRASSVKPSGVGAAEASETLVQTECIYFGSGPARHHEDTATVEQDVNEMLEKRRKAKVSERVSE